MKFLKHAFIRHKAAMDRLPFDGYRIEVARTAEQYRSAFRLLQIGYVFEGIEPVGGRVLRITEHHVLRESTVLLAYEGDKVVGTMTLTLDSSAGLPLDGDYPARLAALRSQGRRLAEIGSFAIVRRCWRSGVAQLIGLSCVQLGVRQGVEQFVIGVHPRAADVYSALYGFRRFGTPRSHNTLNAPVQALEVDRGCLEAHLRRHYRRATTGTTIADHACCGVPLPCFELPRDVRSRRFTRRKMKTDVFAQIFGRESDRLETLSKPVRKRLACTDPRRLSA